MIVGTNGQLTLLLFLYLSPRKTLRAHSNYTLNLLIPRIILTLMRYFPGHNPFNLFDFSAAIPNPATREKARTDDIYKKRYNSYNNRK